MGSYDKPEITIMVISFFIPLHYNNKNNEYGKER